jgi:hypothetical protein
LTLGIERAMLQADLTILSKPCIRAGASAAKLLLDVPEALERVADDTLRTKRRNS